MFHAKDNDNFIGLPEHFDIAVPVKLNYVHGGQAGLHAGLEKRNKMIPRGVADLFEKNIFA
jgi:hypothetical protein